MQQQQGYGKARKEGCSAASQKDVQAEPAIGEGGAQASRGAAETGVCEA